MLPLRVWILAGALVAAVATGWGIRDKLCDAAVAEAALQAERARHEATKLDLEAASLTMMVAGASSEWIDERANQREERIREIEDWIGKNSAGRCRLGADGVRRLLAISPR